MDSDESGLTDMPAFAGRSVFQIAFVVPDLEEALARHVRLFGGSEWRCWTFGSADHQRCSYRGMVADFTTRLALNNSAPQLELIEPRSGSGPHREWLDARGEGVHHLGIVVPSVADAIAQAASQGYETVADGSGIGHMQDGAWAYIDTSVPLGLMIEAVEPPTSMPAPASTWPSADTDAA